MNYLYVQVNNDEEMVKVDEIMENYDNISLLYSMRPDVKKGYNSREIKSEKRDTSKRGSLEKDLLLN